MAVTAISFTLIEAQTPAEIIIFLVRVGSKTLVKILSAANLPKTYKFQKEKSKQIEVVLVKVTKPQKVEEAKQ